MESASPNIPSPSLQYPRKLSSAMTLQSSRPQPDEGFSEETRSLADSDMVYAEDEDLLSRILLQAADKRKFFAEAIIRSLSNAEKNNIGKFCYSLTHFDPAAYLPNELMLQILSYVSPKDLLSCSETSRSWRDRSHDEKLWRSSFAQEGWVVDTTKLASYEKSRAANMDFGGKGSRKRPVGEAFGDPDLFSVQSKATASLQGNVSESDHMEGVESGTSHTHHGPLLSQPDVLIDSAASNSGALRVGAPMFRTNTNSLKLSWTYLYKQRRRLEQNWDEGRCKTFQLPSPQHPADGHSECVYTIQHTTRYLVSGSRDKTIRIWDLNTYRLRSNSSESGPRSSILMGHQASVLCLQFDERPEHDIIVSGGSDALVIIWKFSTGEIIKQLEGAHSESVLNLRFDDRYIVTCSKDKTIKVWNRRRVSCQDDILPTVFAANLATTGVDFVSEYTLLSKLEGHGAAVNAVMIYGNQIVSASGDRTLRAWDIKTETPIKNYRGHSKGIACVQFDGRRIVSGSSDNSVRIFDAETQAEVACLQGHHNLVRTVQARFGDLNTVTDEELEDEARQADRDFFQALENGMQPSHPRHAHNAGSRRPEHMMAYGTKVPPGGGGGRWSKIVSGSYDETIIVWKKDRDGNWKEQHRFPQNQSNHGHQRRRPHQTQHGNILHSLGAALLPQAVQNQVGRDADAVADQFFVQAGQSARAAQQDAAAAQPQAQNIAGIAGQVPLSQLIQHAPQQPTPALNPSHQAPNPAPAATQPAVNQQGHQVTPMAPRVVESNRVFKLQFDARRIISCSQNKVIVGWDFADGDKDLENIGQWSVETP